MKLRVEGEVREPKELGFEELAALPGQIADVSTLVPGREGGAVPFASVLEAVGVDAGATHVVLSALDFTTEAPLEPLRHAVLLYRIGDEPLPQTQGGPVRFLVPNLEECNVAGVDRCTNVKSLSRITIRRGPGTA